MGVNPSQTIGEWREIAEWDWVLLGEGHVLHAVGALDNGDMADEDWFGIGSTECGRAGELCIPGVFTRMKAPRCSRCCERTGMPQGNQSPKNVDECRPIVEGRLEALR